MIFTITRQNLHQGLAAVSASIPTKTTLPVLSNILLEAKNGSVWMSGTDLDVAVRVQVPAEVESPGSLTAPGKKLQEIARELPDRPVEVIFEHRGPVSVQTAFRSIEFQLPELDPGEYTLHLKLELAGREPAVRSRPIIVE